MKDIFPKEKISVIIDHIKKKPFMNLDQSLSISYPEGKTAYFKQRIFDLKQQILSESFIGYAWVHNGCVYAVDSDWLQKCMVHFYKKETEIIAWEGLELFLRKYFQLMVYEEIVKENETEQPDIKPITPELINTMHKKKPETNYPDKFYAWYHGIRIVLGKETSFPNNFGKKEIIEFGTNTYGTGEGFYKVFSHLDLTQTYTFLKSMNSHDRANWKKKLIDISNKNADILDYLSKFSN